MTRFERSDLNPRAAERRLALVSTLRSPQLLLRHGWACGRFLLDYGLMRLRRRITRDPHGLGKSVPSCVAKMPLLPAGSDRDLLLPGYPVNEGTARAPRPAFDGDANDSEAYFARQRWHSCLYALMDRETAACAATECAEWIAQAPSRVDPAWEPYSTAERVVNLIVLLAAEPVARSGIATDVACNFVDESLAWIDGHLEYYGAARTNNHILNDARALVVGGAARQNKRAVEKGLTLLACFGEQLFQPGGFLRERSSHYQVVVTNWLLDAVHFGRFAANRTPESSRQLETIERIACVATGAAVQLQRRMGVHGTFIGDISPDCPPELSWMRLQRLYPAASAISPSSEDAIVDDWAWLSRGTHQVVACAIAGTIFPLRIPTHGHSDIGHFIWNWRGISVLADAGRTRYTKDVVSAAQSDARGHNLPLVNGLAPLAESMIAGGRWLLEPHSRASVRRHLTTNSFTIAHDGFARVRHTGQYERQVRLGDGGVTIEDRFDGSRVVDLDMLWHFGPDFTPAGTDALDHRECRVVCRVESSRRAPAATEWQEYTHASAYGEARRAPLMRLRWRMPLPATITTTLALSPCAASQAF